MAFQTVIQHQVLGSVLGAGSTAQRNSCSWRHLQTSQGVGGQGGKEVTALPIHRTARVRPSPSLCAGINPPHTQGFPGRSCLANANPKAAGGQGERAGSVQLGAGTWVYKYVCVKAGACGNRSCLVKDSLRSSRPRANVQRGAMQNISLEKD